MVKFLVFYLSVFKQVLAYFLGDFALLKLFLRNDVLQNQPQIMQNLPIFHVFLILCVYHSLLFYLSALPEQTF